MKFYEYLSIILKKKLHFFPHSHTNSFICHFLKLIHIRILLFVLHRLYPSKVIVSNVLLVFCISISFSLTLNDLFIVINNSTNMGNTLMFYSSICHFLPLIRYDFKIFANISLSLDKCIITLNKRIKDKLNSCVKRKTSPNN